MKLVIIKTIFGLLFWIFFTLIGWILIFAGDFISGIIVIIGSFIILPLINNLFRKKFKIKKMTTINLGIMFLIFMVVIFSVAKVPWNLSINQTLGNNHEMLQETESISDVVCSPDWVCSDWTECNIIGNQVRRCQDNNLCDTSKEKPYLTQTCIPSKELIKSSAINVSYDDLFRYNERYVDETIYFRGEIIQAIEESGHFDLIISTDNWLDTYFDDELLVSYQGQRVLEGDIVDVWGTVKGLYTYTSVLGAPITVPDIIAKHLEIVKKAGEQ
jgi:hypothetical protein